MTATATGTPPVDVDVELLPGYRVEPETGAWLTLPWPAGAKDLPPSLLPGILAWVEGRPVWGIEGLDGPRLLHHLTGDPWQFTVGQLRFLHLWYALRPDGRWLFRSGVKRGAKGTGKDPLGAAVSMIEARGPVVFDRWVNGQPVARPHQMALVQIAANSEHQAKDLLRVANAMVSADFAAESFADKGETRTQFENGARVELLVRSEASTEGDPATAIILNEPHHMTHTSGGQRTAAVARRNVAKSPGGHARVLELTNTHLPGEESVAEDSFDAWQAQVEGRTRRRDILYDSREAPPHLSLHDEEQLMAGLAAAYADSPWSDLERIRDEAQDPRVTLADSIRFYFNSLPTNEAAWVDPRKFDALADGTMVLADGEPVAMFLDCSKSTDATVLAACRVSDGAVKGLGGWQRPHGDRGKGWLAPRHEVDATVRAAFETFDVQWFGVDPSPARDDETEAQYWGELVDAWHRDYRDRVLIWSTPGVKGNAVLFDMRLSHPGGVDRNRQFTEAAEATAAAIDDDGTLRWDGNPMLRQHTHNARRRPNAWGVSLGKQSRSSRKLVDYAVGMVGARLGRRLVLNSGKKREEKPARSGVVW